MDLLFKELVIEYSNNLLSKMERPNSNLIKNLKILSIKRFGDNISLLLICGNMLKI